MGATGVIVIAFRKLIDDLFHGQTADIALIQIQVSNHRLQARRAQDLLLHGRQSLVDVVGGNRGNRLSLGLLDKNQRLRGIPLRQNSRCAEPQAAAYHGEQKDKHESPPDYSDDILRADFLMNHLSFSCGCCAAALKSLNYLALTADGPKTIIFIGQ